MMPMSYAWLEVVDKCWLLGNGAVVLTVNFKVTFG